MVNNSKSPLWFGTIFAVFTSKQMYLLTIQYVIIMSRLITYESQIERMQWQELYEKFYGNHSQKKSNTSKQNPAKP